MGDCPYWQPAIAVIILQSVIDVFTWLINSLFPLKFKKIVLSKFKWDGKNRLVTPKIILDYTFYNILLQNAVYLFILIYCCLDFSYKIQFYLL